MRATLAARNVVNQAESFATVTLRSFLRFSRTSSLRP